MNSDNCDRWHDISVREKRHIRAAAFILSLCFAHYQLAIAADISSPSVGATNDSFPVLIHVDASQSKGELHPIWRFFGADEPNYATMRNGKKLISELGALGVTGTQPKPVYFRAHNLLTSNDGTAAFK